MGGGGVEAVEAVAVRGDGPEDAVDIMSFMQMFNKPNFHSEAEFVITTIKVLLF